MNEFTSVSRRDLLAAESTANDMTLKISSDLNRRDVVDLGDGVFFNIAMFTFHNNKYTNAFFVNEIKDREFSDLSASYNIKYDLIESSITLKDPTTDGVYLSTKLCTDTSYESELNDFFLVVDEDIPAGCDILYYIITDRDKIYPIKPNGTTPLTINEVAERPVMFRFKAVINGNGIDHPSINSFAILYHDKFIEESYGLINPDLSNETNVDTMDDIITLIRNPYLEDKLVTVLSSLETVKLIYETTGEKRLKTVSTYSNSGNFDKTEEDTLLYGNYQNSEGVTEEVLTQIAIKKDFK